MDRERPRGERREQTKIEVNWLVDQECRLPDSLIFCMSPMFDKPACLHVGGDGDGGLSHGNSPPPPPCKSSHFCMLQRRPSLIGRCQTTRRPDKGSFPSAHLAPHRTAPSLTPFLHPQPTDKNTRMGFPWGYCMLYRRLEEDSVMSDSPLVCYSISHHAQHHHSSIQRQRTQGGIATLAGRCLSYSKSKRHESNADCRPPAF